MQLPLTPSGMDAESRMRKSSRAEATWGSVKDLKRLG